MFVIRVAYPGGHSVWLTRRFPTATWGPEKDALPFPTEADAAEYNFAASISNRRPRWAAGQGGMVQTLRENDRPMPRCTRTLVSILF